MVGYNEANTQLSLNSKDFVGTESERSVLCAVHGVNVLVELHKRSYAVRRQHVHNMLSPIFHQLQAYALSSALA